MHKCSSLASVGEGWMSLAWAGPNISCITMKVSSHPFWMKTALASAALAATTLLSASMAAAQQVDLELFLSMDVSGSIDGNEFNLQKQGYVQAFQDAALQAAIASKPNGVAVALGQWSTTANSPLSVGWTLLKTPGDSTAFAALINGISRQSSGSTCVACGINAAVTSIEGNTFFGGGRVIDVSGDGSQNQNAGNGPATTPAARNAAEALGIRINGLPILGSEAGLQAWYENNVKTSDGFVLAANDFADFDRAVALKITKELEQAPTNSVPGPLPLLGAGMAFGFSRRLRKRINLATLA